MNKKYKQLQESLQVVNEFFGFGDKDEPESIYDEKFGKLYAIKYFDFIHWRNPHFRFNPAKRDISLTLTANPSKCYNYHKKIISMYSRIFNNCVKTIQSQLLKGNFSENSSNKYDHLKKYLKQLPSLLSLYSLYHGSRGGIELYYELPKKIEKNGFNFELDSNFKIKEIDVVWKE